LVNKLEGNDIKSQDRREKMFLSFGIVKMRPSLFLQLEKN